MITNYHVLRIRYHGATDHLGSRISIVSDRFNQRRWFDYDDGDRTALDQAARILQRLGYNIIGQGEGPQWDYIITDTFKGLK